jgi:two-component system response regulator YesN
VDDETLIRQGIKHYLNWEQEGFQIVGEASNGKEALQLIDTMNPHILITDIVMPMMDGEELTRIVKERYPQIEIIILSSFGEFDYVRSTFQSGVVDYILKPKLDAQGLLKALKKAAGRIPDLQSMDKQMVLNLSVGQVIQKMISGYEADYESASIMEVFPYPRFCLVGMDLKRGQTELPKHMKEKIESELKDASYSIHFEQKMILVNGNNFSKIITLAKRLANSEPDLGFALSEEFTDFKQIRLVYKENLLPLLSYRFYFPEIPLLMKKDLPNPEPRCDSFNLDWFAGEFKRKNFDSAFTYLQDHVSSLSRCYKTDVFEYKAFFGNIIFNITILLGNMEYEVKNLENTKYSYFKLIDEAQTAKEAVDLLNQFIAEANKCIFSSQNQPDNFNMKKLMEYIHDHYAEPLTLTEVAKHFHFNPSYLSSYFSNHNSEGFIEYLNRIRIEEASKLLIQGTAAISEISGMVGYSDHSYFCRVFKKIKGLSPSQFRRKQYMR